MRKFLHEYMEYSDGTKVDNGWWEINGNKLYNSMGGWHSYHPEPDDEIVEVEDYHDLDWSHLLDPDSPYGWLSPDGEWFGCDYMQHSMIADYIFNKEEEELDEEGYIKIFRHWDSWQPDYYASDITKAQRDWMMTHNVELKPQHREL